MEIKGLFTIKCSNQIVNIFIPAETVFVLEIRIMDVDQ